MDSFTQGRDMIDTSGNLIADRRWSWGEASAAAGDFRAAADLFEQVLELVPEWAPAWAALGKAREILRDHAGAEAAWREVLARDPQGRLGAPLHLARLRGTTPPAMPASYVAALFDDYAPRFDQHLTEHLSYCGPAVILAALQSLGAERRFGRVLDLGCGTGLMGLALRDQAEAIDGIDLSPAMIARARQTECYSALTVGALEALLGTLPACGYDLMTAADVLVYCGALTPLFGDIRRLLRQDGLLAATLQAEAGEAFTLGADLRYAHSRVYVEACLLKAGLRPLLLREASTRTENGLAVPGWLLVAAPAVAAAA